MKISGKRWLKEIHLCLRFPHKSKTSQLVYETMTKVNVNMHHVRRVNCDSISRNMHSIVDNAINSHQEQKGHLKQNLHEYRRDVDNSIHRLHIFSPL